jgi:hypothetical protein
MVVRTRGQRSGLRLRTGLFMTSAVEQLLDRALRLRTLLVFILLFCKQSTVGAK